MESTDPEILQAVAIALDHPRTGRGDPTAEDAPQTQVTRHEIEWCSPGGPTQMAPTLLASSAGLSGAILTMGTKEIIPLHSRGPHHLQQNQPSKMPTGTAAAQASWETPVAL